MCTGRAVTELIPDLRCFTLGNIKSSKSGVELHIIFILSEIALSISYYLTDKIHRRLLLDESCPGCVLLLLLIPALRSTG